MTEMQKAKVSIVERVVDAPTTAKAVVDEIKDGPVTIVDKAKNYYKGLISFTSILLAILVENQELATQILGVDHSVNKWIAAGILFLGNIGLVLKENEKWVNKVPDQDVFPHPTQQ